MLNKHLLHNKRLEAFLTGTKLAVTTAYQRYAKVFQAPNRILWELSMEDGPSQHLQVSKVAYRAQK